MSVMRPSADLLRCYYTGESVQQVHRAIGLLKPGTPPIPTAASFDQQFLEARVFVNLLEFRNCYTHYPLGIAAVNPEPNGITLQVESEERAAEILLNLLPTYVSDQEVHGVPGLRITRRELTAVELRVLGTSTRLRLAGLPATVWRKAVARMISKWIDPTPAFLCWKSSPRAWTEAESAHRARWEGPDDEFTQIQRRGAWLGSGMLRRAALLHRVSNTFFADGYQGGGETAVLVLRTSHVRGQGPGPHNIVNALAHPVLGLPLHVKRFRGDTDEKHYAEQHFILGDAGKTAVLDLRTESAGPGSRLDPELWQDILRRLPTSEFTESLPLGVLAGLWGAGKA